MDINNVDTNRNTVKEITLSNLTLMKCAFNELIKTLLMLDSIWARQLMTI